MKKTLLCLAIGITSFYFGVFTHSLFYWRNEKLEVLRIEEKEVCIFDISENLNNSKFPSNRSHKLYLPFTGGGYGYYYNLPSSKGRHAPDFSLDLYLYVRKPPSPIDLQPFEFESVTYDERIFSFMTKEINQVKYSMEGFLPNEKNGFTIKGTLIKYRKGVIIFRRKVVFREAIPEC